MRTHFVKIILGAVFAHRGFLRRKLAPSQRFEWELLFEVISHYLFRMNIHRMPFIMLNVWLRQLCMYLSNLQITFHVDHRYSLILFFSHLVN